MSAGPAGSPPEPAAALAALLAPTLERGARWSVELREAGGAAAAGRGRVIAAHRPTELLPTASLAKILLLVEVAERIEDGRLDAAQPLRRDAVPPVADSGLWQHLRTDVLPLADAAALVGAVSDNLATNVLLERVGLPAVQAQERLAPGGSRLLDRVRDHRGPADPPCLSQGCAGDWAGIMAALAAGDRGGPGAPGAAVSARVLGWLRLGTDLSMVGGALGLDPLAHGEPDRGISLISKTGTDDGVRADAGLVTGPAGRLAYAAICRWDPGAGTGSPDPQRDEVLSAMRGIGALLRELVAPAAPLSP